MECTPPQHPSPILRPAATRQAALQHATCPSPIHVMTSTHMSSHACHDEQGMVTLICFHRGGRVQYPHPFPMPGICDALYIRHVTHTLIFFYISIASNKKDTLYIYLHLYRVYPYIFIIIYPDNSIYVRTTLLHNFLIINTLVLRGPQCKTRTK